MSGIPNARLQGLIGLIYDAALDPGRWAEVMTTLARVYGGRAVLFAEDARTPGASIFGIGLIDLADIRSYQEHYTATNIWTPLIEPLPTGAVFDSRVVPEHEFERSEWYNGWLKPQDLYHSVGFVVTNEDGLQTRMSIMRPERAGAFGDGDLRTWRVLGRHAQRAFQIHRQLAIARLERDAAREGLDRLGLAAFLVDPAGRLLSANTAATALIEIGDGLRAIGGRLAARRQEVTDRLMALIAAAARTAAGRGTHPGGAIALPRCSQRPLSAVVAPMCGEAFGMGLPLPLALLLVSDPERVALGNPASLRALFGLTEAEARLAAALANGNNLQDIAEATGTSIETLRTHVKRMLKKTAVKRQSELVAVLLKSAVALDL